jgi:predicted transcriptional regulator
VQTALGQERELQYTTVLKMLLTMHEKGQVQRDETDRSHVYHAVKDRASTQRGLLRDLLDRAFGGSARELVAMALDEGPLAQEEQAEIQELLANARKHKKV